MIEDDIPITSKAFFLVLEETIVDKEEHKRSSILHRILKAVRENSGVDPEKFLLYLSEKGIQPNPLLLVQIRAIRKKRARRSRASSSALKKPSRPTALRGEGSQGMIRKASSSASVKEDLTASYSSLLGVGSINELRLLASESDDRDGTGAGASAGAGAGRSSSHRRLTIESDADDESTDVGSLWDDLDGIEESADRPSFAFSDGSR